MINIQANEVVIKRSDMKQFEINQFELQQSIYKGLWEGKGRGELILGNNCMLYDLEKFYLNLFIIPISISSLEITST